MTETHREKHTLQFEPEAAPEEGDEDMEVPKPPSLLVFSGGTAFNSVAGIGQLSYQTSRLCNSQVCTGQSTRHQLRRNSKQQCRNLAEFHDKGSACAACI